MTLHSNQHAQTTHYSEKDATTSERRYPSIGCADTRCGRRRKSRCFGRCFGSSRLWCQEKAKSSPPSKKTKKGRHAGSKTTVPTSTLTRQSRKPYSQTDIKTRVIPYTAAKLTMRRPRRATKRRRRQRGRGVLGILGSAAKMGYKLGKDKRYKRMGLMGVAGSYRRRPAPSEV